MKDASKTAGTPNARDLAASRLLANTVTSSRLLHASPTAQIGTSSLNLLADDPTICTCGVHIQPEESLERGVAGSHKARASLATQRELILRQGDRQLTT